MKPAPGTAPARLREAWKEVGGALRHEPHRPLPARLAEAAAALAGATRAVLFMREKGTWVAAAAVGDDATVLRLPEPCPAVSGPFEGALWVRLEAEGELHGLLGLDGVGDEDGVELVELLGSFFGPALGAT